MVQFNVTLGEIANMELLKVCGAASKRMQLLFRPSTSLDRKATYRKQQSVKMAAPAVGEECVLTMMILLCEYV